MWNRKAKGNSYSSVGNKFNFRKIEQITTIISRAKLIFLSFLLSSIFSNTKGVSRYSMKMDSHFTVRSNNSPQRCFIIIFKEECCRAFSTVYQSSLFSEYPSLRRAVVWYLLDPGSHRWSLSGQLWRDWQI